MKKIVIDKFNYNQRVDKYILKSMNAASKSFIYKMFRKKRIKLNGSKIKGSEILKIGDEIIIYFSEETINKFKTEKQNLEFINDDIDIIYENDNMIICNKQKELLSQPNDKDSDCILNRIRKYLKNKGEEYNNVSICNRLDFNTTGVIICSKNFITTQYINNLIKDGKIVKKYIAIVKGKLDNIEGILTSYWKDLKNGNVIIDNDEKEEYKKIITGYSVIKCNDDYSLLEINLITGKKHQIRAHLAYFKHPIVGDKKYGDEIVNKNFKKRFNINNQMLHAKYIEIENRKYIAQESTLFSKVVKEIF